MTLVLGLAPEQPADSAVHLAALLARSAGEPLLVAVVLPRPWFPGPAKVDAEYRGEMHEAAEAALTRARESMPVDVEATFLVHDARSAPTGLLELVEEHAASMVVLGSSSAGVFGHIALGSVTDRLLHSSPVPVALAPRGYRCGPDTRVGRVTAAYGGSGEADDLVLAAASVAARIGATLRIASFAVWSRPAYTTRLGSDGEDPVLAQWVAELEGSAHTLLAEVEDLARPPGTVEAVIGHGRSWAESIEDVGWQAGDVLVIGSSGLGPVSRVFLGSRAAKILRHSPVPVVLVPKARAEDLAHEAAAD